MGAAVAAACAAAVLLAAGGAAAAEPVTRVELRSEPGDFVGNGRTFTYTPDDAAIRSRSRQRLPPPRRTSPRHRRGSCPFARRRIAGRRNLARLFDGRRLRPRTVIAIRHTPPGATGRSLRFPPRPRGRAPLLGERCRPPGARRPVSCG